MKSRPEPVTEFSTSTAVLAEQHDEWTEMRRYVGLDVLEKSRLTIAGQNTQPEEVTLTAITLKSQSPS